MNCRRRVDLFCFACKGVLRDRVGDDAVGVPLPVPRRVPQAGGAQEPVALVAAGRPHPRLRGKDSQGTIRRTCQILQLSF